MFILLPSLNSSSHPKDVGGKSDPTAGHKKMIRTAFTISKGCKRLELLSPRQFDTSLPIMPAAQIRFLGGLIVISRDEGGSRAYFTVRSTIPHLPPAAVE
ncbi:hypothetical protein AJ87_35745 [Rhizobium yanglingense]|nr:hypothetical protein AJ87_35745 [Rhizobium yanglingense]